MHVSSDQKQHVSNYRFFVCSFYAINSQNSAEDMKQMPKFASKLPRFKFSA